MLAKCANPSCSTPFRYLDTGTLFRLESDPWCASDDKVREYFWVCKECSSTFTLRLDDSGKIRVASLQNPPGKAEDGLDFILLDRQCGRLLSRITLFHHRANQNGKARGGRLHP